MASRPHSSRGAPPAKPRPSDGEFADAYREHVAYVWNSLRRLGARESDVEDLVHDVFVTAYRRLDAYDTDRPMRRWLFGIAFRVLSAERRRARNRLEVPSDNIDVASEAPRHDEATAARRLLMAALAELPIEQRAVLVMHDVDGYSAPEIAESLELPVNTVYSRLRLARAKFAMAARRLQPSRGES